jgi:hypothetical protein
MKLNCEFPTNLTKLTNTNNLRMANNLTTKHISDFLEKETPKALHLKSSKLYIISYDTITNYVSLLSNAKYCCLILEAMCNIFTIIF